MTMTREELVKSAKSAIAFYCGAQSSEAAALAVLYAIEAAGLRIVPVEATTAQLYAGQRAWLADAERKSSTLYSAMVAASPLTDKAST